MGIISNLKLMAPLLLYLIACFLIFAALRGKTEWILLFLTGILPLRNVIERLQMFPLGKDLVDVLLIFALIGTVIQAISKKEQGEKGEFTAIHWIVAAMIGYTFLTVINGSIALEKALLFSIKDPRVQSWKNFCIMPMLFFLTFSTVKDKRMVWWMVTAMCMSMVLMDYYTGQQVMWYRNIESRDKIHGTFAHLGPNEVAAFYNQYTILLMGLFFHMKYGLKKLGLAVLILINLYVVVFLFSRAAYVGLALGMFFLFSVKKRLLLIPLILAALSWQTVMPEKVIERIEMTTGDYNELDKSSERRIIAWKEGLELFGESPIFGVGYGVFSRSGLTLHDTHNIYVKILAEQGLVGIVLFLSLLFSFFMKGIGLYLRAGDNLSKGLGLGFAMAIIVLSVNNVFGDRWTYMEVGSYMWITAALVARLLVIELNSKDQPSIVHIKRKKKTLNDEFPIKN